MQAVALLLHTAGKSMQLVSAMEHFLITSIKVKEAMRDMGGHATRAIVDIELQEVPSYQVSDGSDLTSKALTAVTGAASTQSKLKAIVSQCKWTRLQRGKAAVGKPWRSSAGSKRGSNGGPS